MNNRIAPLLPLLFLSGANPRQIADDEEAQAIVRVGFSCSESELLAELPVTLEPLQFVVAAGPNRLHSLPSTVHLIQQVSERTHGEISIVIRMDEGEEITALPLELLNTLPLDVSQLLVVQPLGTSYTEVADSILKTEASHLVFLAHNRPLEWRLELAARNTVSAGTTGEQLKSVQVLCHDGSSLPDNSGKEIGSLLLDWWYDLDGHEAIMTSSQGGQRWKRMKEGLGL